jgi:RNA polymerase sigma factor (sigma-70 family)
VTHLDTSSDSLAVRAARAFAAYRDGDPARMNDLVDMLNSILWHTARAQGLASALAEDAVQTTWLRLVENADRIGDPQAVMAWLIVTVKRESWRAGKQAQRHTADPEVAVDEPASGLGPEAVAILSERQMVLWRHLGTLSPACRELLRVVAFADRPDYASVSESLGMPLGSIGPTRGRCLAKLRSLLQGDPVWGGGS